MAVSLFSCNEVTESEPSMLLAFCSALLCNITQRLLLYFVIVLLACMTWVTATWGRVSLRVTEITGNFTVPESGHPEFDVSL